MYIKIQYLGFYESIKKETECQDLSIYESKRKYIYMYEYEVNMLYTYIYGGTDI